jgi:hypothetical protein
MGTGSPAVSVVLPFADHEEIVGAACRRLAEQLASLGLDAELIAVDAGSGDNSHAVLALLRADLPSLRIETSASPARVFAAGARVARGRVLLLIDPTAAQRSLAPLGRALRQVDGGDADLVLVSGHYAVARRSALLPVIEAVRATGGWFERRLAHRARTRRLAVEVWPESIGGGRREAPRERGLGRLLSVLTAARASR